LNHPFVATLAAGPPGWGKTTSVQKALLASDVNSVQLGSYSTPLDLYNFLHQNQDRVIVIDDCAGLFSEQTSMAILKAATWSGPVGKRLIRWGSTSNKAITEGILRQAHYYL
jgi:hypothetical protein